MIDKLKNGSYKLVVAATGGGSHFINTILSEPGASKLLLDARIPYGSEATKEFLGFEILGRDKQGPGAVSAEMAKALAGRAYVECVALAQDTRVTPIGVGITAALPTTHGGRNGYRVFFSVVVPHAVLVCQEDLNDCTRAQAEKRITDCVLATITAALQSPVGTGAEFVEIHPLKRIYYPGSFNPIHRGHLDIVKECEYQTKEKVTLLVPFSHPQKGELDEETRLKRYTGLSAYRPLVMYRDNGLFFNMFMQFPRGTRLLVGQDAYERAHDPRYWNSVAAFNETRAVAYQREQKFIVAERGDLPLIRQINDEVLKFTRSDSSTAIRERSKE